MDGSISSQKEKLDVASIIWQKDQNIYLKSSNLVAYIAHMVNKKNKTTTAGLELLKS